VAQIGMSMISYDQWKVNKFCLLSDGITGNKIIPADLQNATSSYEMPANVSHHHASVSMLPTHTAERTALERYKDGVSY